MRDADYRARPGVSWTTCLRPLVAGKSPAQVRHRLDNPDTGDTASRGYLRAVHCLALEPESFEQEFTIYAGRRDKRHKAYQAALEEAGDRTILTPKEHAKAQAVADAVRRNPTVAALLARPDAMPEQVLEWAEPAVGLARGRADLLTGVALLDLKTWGSLDPVAVRRDIVRQCVDAQLAWYARGGEALLGLEPHSLRRGVIVATDGGTDGCPEARVYWLDESLCATGDARLNAALELYAECDRANHWPTAADSAPAGEAVGAPTWLLRELGLLDLLDDNFTPTITRLD